MPRTSLLGEYHLVSRGTCTTLWKPDSIILVGNVRKSSALAVWLCPGSTCLVPAYGKKLVVTRPRISTRVPTETCAIKL